MDKPKIILIGGGGHCKSCIDVIEQENKFEIEGIIDLPSKLGQNILGYKVIANDDDITKFAEENKNFLITIGHLGETSLRDKIFNLIKNNGGNLPVIISPFAIVSKHSDISEGTIIMHQAIVNSGAIIKENCIINSKALIEHDAIIEDNTHISTSTIINGDCKVGKNCLVGSASVIKHSVSISNDVVIGAGAVVTTDIIESGVYVGCPAKKIK